MTDMQRLQGRKMHQLGSSLMSIGWMQMGRTAADDFLSVIGLDGSQICMPKLYIGLCSQLWANASIMESSPQRFRDPFTEFDCQLACQSAPRLHLMCTTFLGSSCNQPAEEREHWDAEVPHPCAGLMPGAT